MAVQTHSADGDSDAEYRATLRDEEFMDALESHVDNLQFNDKTGHIITKFRNNDKGRAHSKGKLFDIARIYAYEVVRVSSNKHGLRVVLG